MLKIILINFIFLISIFVILNYLLENMTNKLFEKIEFNRFKEVDEKSITSFKKYSIYIKIKLFTDLIICILSLFFAGLYMIYFSQVGNYEKYYLAYFVGLFMTMILTRYIIKLVLGLKSYINLNKKRKNF